MVLPRLWHPARSAYIVASMPLAQCTDARGAMGRTPRFACRSSEGSPKHSGEAYRHLRQVCANAGSLRNMFADVCFNVEMNVRNQFCRLASRLARASARL